MNNGGRTTPQSLDWFAFARWAALGSAAAAMVSVAISQSLLGVALGCLLLSRRAWRLPMGFPWFCLFAGWTVLSLLLNGDPLGGLPQIRKLYVWLLLFVLVTTLRSASDFKLLLFSWVGLSSLAALRGLWQFNVKWQAATQAGTDFYQGYVGSRITGFMSHWMTFSSQLLFGLLAAAALLLLAQLSPRVRLALAAASLLLATALLLAITRGVWIAAAAGGVYLLFVWRRWTVLALPALAVLLFFFGPEVIRTRLTSLVRPRGQTDSNLHRVVTWRTGVEMIKANPIIGVGPEQVGRRFMSYVPQDVSKPLPEGWYGHLHNFYLQFSAERGIPAALFLLLFLLAQARHWISRFRAPVMPEWAFHTAMALLIGVMITGLFEHNLGDSEVLALTLGALGGAEAAGREV
jgi:O-antigen ligase